MSLLFASSSRFGEEILKSIIEKEVEVDYLVTLSDRKMGRGQSTAPLPIKETALLKGIQVFEVEGKDDFDRIVEKLSPEMVIVAGFGVIIKKETLEKSFFINAHPSLLPKYRGPSPIQSFMLSDEKVTGTTIIKMDERIDHGPIIDQKELEIERVNYLTAEKILADLSAEMIVEIIYNIKNKKELTFISQEEDKATYTKKIMKQEGKINWSESAENILKQIQTHNPWPGAYTYLNGKLLKLLSASLQEQNENGPFGEHGKTYLGTNHTIAVQTGKDFLLIEELQLEGKNPTTAKEFLQGNISLIGSVFSSEKE